LLQDKLSRKGYPAIHDNGRGKALVSRANFGLGSGVFGVAFSLFRDKAEKLVLKSNLAVTPEGRHHKPVSTDVEKKTDRLVAGFVMERR